MATNPQTRRALIDQIPTEEDRQAPAAQPQSGIHSSELGRQVYNTAMALPGVGGIGKVAQTGGLVSRVLNTTAGVANKVATGTAALAALPAGAEAPEPAPTGAGRGTVNPPSVNPQLEAARQQDWSRQGMTNAQVAQANPEGRVQFERQPNGVASFSGSNVSGPVSYANGAGTPLAGAGIDGRGFGGFDSAPAGAKVAIGEGGYAFGSSTAPSAAAAPSQSPVGMSPAQAQQQGLIGERVGYNPAYDQRLGAAGQPSAQNMAAADQLAANQQMDSIGRVATSGNVPQSPAQGLIGRITAKHSGNDWTAREMLRRLKMDADSLIHQSHWAKKGSGQAAQKAYGEALQADYAAMTGGQTGADVEVMRQNAGLQREGMQQDGADRRDARRSLIDAARLGMERETQGFATRAAAQQEQLRSTLLDPNASTEQRALAQRSLAALAGKTAADRMQTVNLPDTTTDMGAVVRGGQALVRILEDGSVQQVPVVGAQQGASRAAPPAAIADLKKNPASAAQFDAIFGAGASARYLGK
ncbi:hypothetical protein [Comamonas aquatica]|uniref:hypothetical protein n=1 Tax=Comamonas aquatica TaxID=225991 RepID=UPI0034D56C43